MTDKSITPDRPASEQLNERRRLAVQMRIDGATLQQIRQKTSLSAPTIIAAYKAWEIGGWSAVDKKPRGRPSGGVLTANQQETLKLKLLSNPDMSNPEVAITDGSLWTIQSATDRATAMGLSITTKTMSRYLERWQMSPDFVPDKLHASDDPAQQAWAKRNIQPLIDLAQRRRSMLYWAGIKVVDDHFMLFAHNSRKQLYWRGTKGNPTADLVQDFLTGLMRSGKSRTQPEKKMRSHTTVVLKGIDIARVTPIRHWLGTQQDSLTVVCPDAEITRSADQSTTASENYQLAIVDENTSDSQRLDNTTDNTTENRMRTSGNLAVAQEGFSNQSFDSANDASLSPVTLTHLQRLEAESIHIMREVVAEADNPVMLYSIGKDSAVMLHLAMKAFYPGKIPFPLLHVDTTWKFRAMYEFREQMEEEYGVEILKHVNQDGLAQGVNPVSHGSALHTDIMKTEGLKQALSKHKFDVAFGGARRDEEKSRAKERVFSFRNSQQRWDPKNQRPELWRLYNTRKNKDESIRVFPLSNWTELDIWMYIHQQNIPVVPLYFAAERPVVERDGMLIVVDDERLPLRNGEIPVMRKVRFRTLGCYPLTGAIESNATTLPQIIQEMLITRSSERQGRMIDHDSAASMEKKKQEGYF